MKQMDIAIPSRGRSDSAYLTHEQIPEEWHDRTFYIVQPEEVALYAERVKGTAISVVPFQHNTVRESKKHAMEIAENEKVLLLDDDVRFFNRRADVPTKLEQAQLHERSRMLGTVEDWLENYAHVGISHREGNNRMEVPYVFNIRCTRAVAFQRSFYLANAPTLAVMEDFEVALRLLTKGHEFPVFTYWAQRQGNTQAEGGCALYRKHEVQDHAARKLAEQFPEFVKLRKKNTRSGLGESTDVTIYWKRAAEAGRAYKEQE